MKKKPRKPKYLLIEENYFQISEKDGKFFAYIEVEGSKKRAWASLECRRVAAGILDTLDNSIKNTTKVANWLAKASEYIEYMNEKET